MKGDAPVPAKRRHPRQTLPPEPLLPAGSHDTFGLWHRSEQDVRLFLALLIEMDRRRAEQRANA